MKWVKTNAATIIGWIAALIAVAYIGGGQVGAINERLDSVVSEQARSRDTAERLDRAVARLEAIVDRMAK